MTSKNLVCLCKNCLDFILGLLKNSSLKINHLQVCKTTKIIRNKMSCWAFFVCSLALVLFPKQSVLIKERHAIFGSYYLCHLMSDVVKAWEKECRDDRSYFYLFSPRDCEPLLFGRHALYGVWSWRIGVEWTESLHMVTQTSSSSPLLHCPALLSLTRYSSCRENTEKVGVREALRWTDGRERGKKRWYLDVACSF